MASPAESFNPAEFNLPRHKQAERRDYVNSWKRRVWNQRREAFFSDKCCESCGSGLFLELHHRDPRIKISHRIWLWSDTHREEEIAKCAVLCTICHDKIQTETRRLRFGWYGWRGKRGVI